MPRNNPHSEITKKRISQSLTRHGMKGTLFYKSWENMKQRCLNPNRPGYRNYGKRGIKVSKEWLRFENFMKDMLPIYKEGLTIERIDNNKGYFKKNCKWITKEQQVLNTRRTTTKKINGKFFRYCKTCDMLKPIEDFVKSFRRYLGRVHICRECMREKSRQYYKKIRSH